MQPHQSVARISDYHMVSSPHGDERDVKIAKLEIELARLRGLLDAEPANDEAQPAPVAAKPRTKSNAAIIRNVIEARNRRGAYLPPSLFSDPAWDMLLDLFLAHHSQIRISVSSLCVASNVPISTALRWLKSMQDRNLVERRIDPLDARRHFIDLSPSGLEAMTSYFSALPGPPPVI